MSARPDRIPFRPDPSATRHGRDVLWCVANAVCKAHVYKRFVQDLLKDDEPATELYRAAVNPMAIGGGGTANQLAATAVEDAVVGLAGPSAAASIIEIGTRVGFEGRASISLPTSVISATDAGGFIAEGSPIPVRKRSITGALTLSPCKFMVITEFSNEGAKYSNFDRINKADLTKAAGLQLDAQMFSSTAGSTSRPAGLFAGVTPITAATAGSEAQEKDVAALVAALASAGGGTHPVFVCAPPQAATLRLRAGAQFTYPILTSGALANGTIACLEISSFVSAFGSVPEFEIADQTALHEEDTSPAALLTAAPVRSLWQTNSSALRMRLECAWGVRATGHIQLIQSCNC
jgi:Phage capsid family